MTSSQVAAERLGLSFEWSCHQYSVKLGRQARCGHWVSSFSTLFLAWSARAVTRDAGLGWAGGAQESSDPSGRGWHADLASVSCLTGVPALSGGRLEGEGKRCPDHSAMAEFRTQGLVCSGNGDVFGYWAKSSSAGQESRGPAHYFPCVHTHVCMCVRAGSDFVGSRDEGEGRCVRPRVDPRACTVSRLTKSDAARWARRGIWLDIDGWVWMGTVLEGVKTLICR